MKEIFFNKQWNRSQIQHLVKEHQYLDYGLHEDLKSLICMPYAEDETLYQPDYYELIFFVPKAWLIDVAKELFNVDDIDYWLQNEYISDESEVVFTKALMDRKVVSVDFTEL